MRNQQPIGIFDSGIGGLTVANAVIKALPKEHFIYFGDTAHLPYGDKSADAIRYYAVRIAKMLQERECKLIVIACNSASSAAYEVLLDFFKDEVPFINVVDPLVEKTASLQLNKVGVIATKATIHSGVYERKLRHFQPNLNIFSLATPLLVPMIEEGYVNNKISHTILDNYLSDPGFRGIEALLLACTHYPLIKPHIESYYDGKIKVLDSTDIVAEAVRKKLNSIQALSDRRASENQFLVSDYTPSFEGTTRIFYGEKVHLEHYPIW